MLSLTHVELIQTQIKLFFFFSSQQKKKKMFLEKWNGKDGKKWDKENYEPLFFFFFSCTARLAQPDLRVFIFWRMGVVEQKSKNFFFLRGWMDLNFCEIKIAFLLCKLIALIQPFLILWNHMLTTPSITKYCKRLKWRTRKEHAKIFVETWSFCRFTQFNKFTII